MYLYTISHRPAPESHSQTFAVQTCLSSREEILSSSPARLSWKPWAPGTPAQLNFQAWQEEETPSDVCSAERLVSGSGRGSQSETPSVAKTSTVSSSPVKVVRPVWWAPHGTTRNRVFLGAISISRRVFHPGCGCSRSALLGWKQGGGCGGEAYVWLDGKVANVILNDLMGNAETWGSKEAALR